MPVIQIRGTSGSGKTTVMRRLMADKSWGWLPANPPIVDENGIGMPRKRPAYYFTRKVAIIGSYESVCGGCDTFKTYHQLKEVIRAAAKYHDLILLEGLMLSDDVLQTVEIHTSIMPVERIYYLTTDVDTCIKRVRRRRKQRGDKPDFNEQKLRDRHVQILKTRERLTEAGIPCLRIKQETLVKTLMDWIEEYRGD